MAQEKTIYVEMIRFYHGKLNGSVRWHEGEVHSVAEEAGKELIERKFAKASTEAAYKKQNKQVPQEEKAEAGGEVATGKG